MQGVLTGSAADTGSVGHVGNGPRRKGLVGLALTSIAAVAAAIRIEEMAMKHCRHEESSSRITDEREPDVKAAARAAWALGDYAAFARATVWEVGPVLADACEAGPGKRLLDVAAGTGNTAIRAAQAGAEVVASDLTPENFAGGRREAELVGVELDWVEADAERLPFEDSEFDIVTSSFGAIFAPNHQAVADELLRVCRPGGVIGMVNFTPEGLIGDFFDALAPFAPEPPPGALPPPLWGDPGHVRELFGDGVESLEMTRHTYVERLSSPAGYRALLKRTFGPIVAIYEALGDDDEARMALDRALMDFAAAANRGSAGGPAEYPYEYLLVLAHKRASGKKIASRGAAVGRLAT